MKCYAFRKKTVVVSLWNDLATNVGQELLDISDKSPIVAIKSLKVGDFQGTLNCLPLLGLSSGHQFTVK